MELQMLSGKEQEQTKSFGPLREDHPRPHYSSHLIIKLTDYGRAEKRVTGDVRQTTGSTEFFPPW